MQGEKQMNNSFCLETLEDRTLLSGVHIPWCAPPRVDCKPIPACHWKAPKPTPICKPITAPSPVCKPITHPTPVCKPVTAPKPICKPVTTPSPVCKPLMTPSPVCKPSSSNNHHSEWNGDNPGGSQQGHAMRDNSYNQRQESAMWQCFSGVVWRHACK